MDIGTLPKTNDGDRFEVSITDRYLKLTIPIPIAKTTALQIVTILMTIGSYRP